MRSCLEDSLIGCSSSKSQISSWLHLPLRIRHWSSHRWSFSKRNPLIFPSFSRSSHHFSHDLAIKRIRSLARNCPGVSSRSPLNFTKFRWWDLQIFQALAQRSVLALGFPLASDLIGIITSNHQKKIISLIPYLSLIRSSTSLID